jgi:hypothetical protein
MATASFQKPWEMGMQPEDCTVPRHRKFGYFGFEINTLDSCHPVSDTYQNVDLRLSCFSIKQTRASKNFERGVYSEHKQTPMVQL